jgi:hypothetical protein
MYLFHQVKRRAVASVAPPSEHQFCHSPALLRSL